MERFWQLPLPLQAGTLLLVAAILTATWVAHPARGDEFQVNTYTPGDQAYADVAALTDGSFAVVWRNAIDLESSELRGRHYDGAGAPLGGEFPVVTDGLQFFPLIAPLDMGQFVVVWTRSIPSSGDRDVFGQRYTSAGVAIGAQFQVNAFTTGSQNNPEVARLSDGGFVVAWQSEGQDGSSYGVFARRYDGLGSAGIEFQVNSYTVSAQRRPDVAALVDGGFVVAWESYQGGSDREVFAQRYASSGAPAGTEFQVNSYFFGSETQGEQVSPVVAQMGDRFVVVWPTTGKKGGHGRLYATSGGAVRASGLKTSFFPQAMKGTPVGVVIAGDWFASPSVDSDGDGSGVFIRKFTYNGKSLGASQIQINTYTTDHQLHPNLAFGKTNVLGNSQFMIVWSSRGQDGSGSGVFGTVKTAFNSAQVTLALKDTKQFKLKFTIKNQEIDTLSSTGINPLVDGAALQIYNTAGTGDAACMRLPNSGWQASRNAAVVKYTDASFSTGPCKTARLEHGKLLTVTCKAGAQPIPYSLDEARQGSVAVRFVSGRTTYCAELAAEGAQDDRAGKFAATTDQAPATCPPAPPGCP